jgi:hypothetical protein
MTDTLFPVSPDEPQKKRVTKRPAAEATVVQPPPLARPKPAIKPIGKIDGPPCDGTAFNSPCNTTVYDIFHEDAGDWLVGCWCCGAVSWMPVVPGHLPARTEYVVHGGRFDGKTFAEIAGEPRGLDTIRIYAADAKRPGLQAEARKWLDGNPSVG